MFSQSMNALGFALLGAATLARAGPCDIYAAGGSPCIAAHSTTRALFNSYSKGLYQVTRLSDGATLDIKPMSAGGIADAAAQDAFCANVHCVISIIYDQSGTGNDLSRAPPGGAAKGPAPGGGDDLARAGAAPIHLNGHKVYGVYIRPGVGYRNNQAVKTATGNGAQGIYAVLDGTHYNDLCCFDYGNAERSSNDTGRGAMEALYFGSKSQHGTGAGKGPWILADLENGLFSEAKVASNPQDPSIDYRFLTAILKGEPNHWSLRGGDATNGTLGTFYNGPRPVGYNPMKLSGAIILGTGGDNSDGAQGTFYEGIMTSTYPSQDTEDSVQANIVAAKYSV